MNLTIYQTQFFKNTQEQDAHYYFPGKVTPRNEIFNRQTNAPLAFSITPAISHYYRKIIETLV